MEWGPSEWELFWATFCSGGLVIGLLGLTLRPRRKSSGSSWKYTNKAGAARAAAELGQELKQKLPHQVAARMAAHELAHAVDVDEASGEIGYDIDQDGKVKAAWNVLDGDRSPEEKIKWATGPARRGDNLSPVDREVLKQALKDKRRSP